MPSFYSKFLTRYTDWELVYSCTDLVPRYAKIDYISHSDFIIPDYNYPGGKQKIKDPKDSEKLVTISYYITINLKRPRSNISEFGFSLDKKGYPIHNSLQDLFQDFPTPPESFADAEKQVEKLNRDFYMDFPTWLGHHSREGWEIFKISRDFRDGSQAKRTWCVFRRKK